MTTAYILINANAGKSKKKIDPRTLLLSQEDRMELVDTTQTVDYAALFEKMQAGDYLILCGGDGTLNRMINSIDGLPLTHDLYYYPAGSGNDFANDLDYQARGETLIPLNEYIRDLPTVTVKGKTYRFINGIGYGIDGYCCEIGDRLKAKQKKVNYTAIAIKGLLYGHKPNNATIEIDGVKKEYRKVWMAPTMHGRFFGGGMMTAPQQDRMSPAKTLSLMVLHDTGKLKTLVRFPSIFSGSHVRYTDMVDLMTGHEITVTFDRPCALQVDGETILDVVSYTARSAGCNGNAQQPIPEITIVR